MNKKLFKAVSLTTAVSVGIAVFFMSNSSYTPRSASRLQDVNISEEEENESESVEGMIKYVNALRANPVTGTVSEQEYMQALNASNLLSAKRSVSTIWTNLGPDNVGGRSRAFLQDIDSSNLMFVGSVSGGLFRSRTRGSSWTPVNDYQENLNVVSIAQNKDRIIVYGTGEGRFVSIDGTESGTPGFAGAGMFRSVDGGNTFVKVSNTSFGNISSMAAEPRNIGGRFYAATDNGLKYSDDGLTWNNGKTGGYMEVKVAVNGDVYASGGKLFKSTAAERGTNWTDITPQGVNAQRMSIAISPQDPNYLYIMVCVNGVLDAVYRSTNAGVAWTKIITGSTDFFDPLGAGNPQGNYNNVLSVDPLNKDKIYMGGIQLAQWTLGSNPQMLSKAVHSDMHIMHWDMSTNPPTFIIGSDGGLFFSSDKLVTFTPKNFGYTTYQAYAVAADYDGNVVGGSQDNGTQYINKKGNTPKSSVNIHGGDGFQAEISSKLSNVIFSESQYGNLNRSRDFGKSQSCIWDRRIARCFVGLTDTNKYCDMNHKGTWAPFNMMIKLWEHPVLDSNQSRLFISRGGQVWMAEDATNMDVTPTWYMIATGLSNNVWDIEVTPDGNSVFIAATGTLHRIDGLNSATYYKWSNPLSIPAGITTTNLNLTNAGGRAVTSVNLDPNNANEALITIGNYGYSIYAMKATNMLGSPTYTNITGNLPAMPVYDGIISYSNSGLMFLGTDLGVYASDDGGASWTAQTNSTNKFPKVSTFALRQYYFPNRNKGIIYAGTHGRGFFECTQYKTNIQTAQIGKTIQTISAYPNPANDYVNVNFKLTDREDITYSVIDVSGKVVKSLSVGIMERGDNKIVIDTKGIQAGVYVITVAGTKPKGTVKLILTH